MAWSESCLGQPFCLQPREFTGRGQNGGRELSWLISAIVQVRDDRGADNGMAVGTERNSMDSVDVRRPGPAGLHDGLFKMGEMRWVRIHRKRFTIRGTKVAGLEVPPRQAGRLVQDTQWRYWVCKAIWVREKGEWTQVNFVGFVAEH